MNRPDTLVNSRQVALSYLNFNQRTFQRKLIKLEYSQGSNKPVADNVAFTNYTQQSWRLATQDNNWKLQILISQPLFRRKITLNMHGLFTTQKTIFSELETIDTKFAQLSTKFKAIFAQKLTISTRFSGTMLTFAESLLGAESAFLRAQWGNEVAYATHGWYFKTHLATHGNFLNARITNSFWNLDLEARKDISKHWSVALKGNNILNLSGIPNVAFTYQPNSIQETNYVQFPGFILLSVSYLL